MVRTLQSGTSTAIASRKGLFLRNFVWIRARELDDNANDDFFFTDHGYNITINAANARTGVVQSHNYIGDDAPITSVEPMPEKIGIEIALTKIRLNILHSAVEDMVRGHNIRNSQVQIHRGYLAASDRKFVGNLEPRKYGYVESVNVVTGGIGEESYVDIGVVSHAREFTRTSHAKWSHEYMQERSSGDTFLEWNNGTEDVPVWWGEEAKA